jgi:hypothetical protein
VDDAGNLLMSQFEDLLGPKTKLVAATHVSNAGTVTQAEKIVELGHRYGARVLIDGAQSIPHIPIDVQALGADFFVFSGHKIYGPTGIGVLYGCEDALEETPPWQGGGKMIADVTLERSLYQGPAEQIRSRHRQYRRCRRPRRGAAILGTVSALNASPRTSTRCWNTPRRGSPTSRAFGSSELPRRRPACCPSCSPQRSPPHRRRRSCRLTPRTATALAVADGA